MYNNFWNDIKIMLVDVIELAAVIIAIIISFSLGIYISIWLYQMFFG